MALAKVLDSSVAKDSFVGIFPEVDPVTYVATDKTFIFYSLHDVTGLSDEHETQEAHIGGTDATAWIIGVRKRGDIVVKRFFLKNDEDFPGNKYMRDWRRLVGRGAQASDYMRPCGFIVLGKDFKPVILFKCNDAYPQKVDWDDLNADDSSVWMETFTLKLSHLEPDDEWNVIPAPLTSYKNDIPDSLNDQKLITW